MGLFTNTIQALKTFYINHNGLTDIGELEALGAAGAIQVIRCEIHLVKSIIKSQQKAA